MPTEQNMKTLEKAFPKVIKYILDVISNPLSAEKNRLYACRLFLETYDTQAAESTLYSKMDELEQHLKEAGDE